MPNDVTPPSPDNELEEARGADGMPIGNNPLPEDNTRPAAAADDGSSTMVPEDHPALDTDVDEDELYNEGINRASGLGIDEEYK